MRVVPPGLELPVPAERVCMPGDMIRLTIRGKFGNILSESLWPVGEIVTVRFMHMEEHEEEGHGEANG